LYTDEAGFTRWIYPEPTAAPATAGSTRGGAGAVAFHIPRASASSPTVGGAAPTRGWISKLGRRLVRVVAWATDGIIGKTARAAAEYWETRHRPYALRAALPGA